MNKEYATASFFVRGFISIPQVTQLMGLKPTSKRRAGKKRQGCWSFASPLKRSADNSLDTHVSALLELLDTKKEAVEVLQKKRYAIGLICVCTHCVSCGYQYYIKKELRRKCDALSLEIIYCLTLVNCKYDEEVYRLYCSNNKKYSGDDYKDDDVPF